LDGHDNGSDDLNPTAGLVETTWAVGQGCGQRSVRGHGVGRHHGKTATADHVDVTGQNLDKAPANQLTPNPTGR